MKRIANSLQGDLLDERFKEIDDTISSLRTIWKIFPALRLGQMIILASGPGPDGKAWDLGRTVYEIPDDKIIHKLKIGLGITKS